MITHEQAYKILSKSPELCEIVKRLKILNEEMDINQINEVINKMDLPLSKHLFLTANYHELIKFDFTNI
jgi:hypothetical protein